MRTEFWGGFWKGKLAWTTSWDGDRIVAIYTNRKSARTEWDDVRKIKITIKRTHPGVRE